MSAGARRSLTISPLTLLEERLQDGDDQLGDAPMAAHCEMRAVVQKMPRRMLRERGVEIHVHRAFVGLMEQPSELRRPRLHARAESRVQVVVVWDETEENE